MSKRFFYCLGVFLFFMPVLGFSQPQLCYYCEADNKFVKAGPKLFKIESFAQSALGRLTFLRLENAKAHNDTTCIVTTPFDEATITRFLRYFIRGFLNWNRLDVESLEALEAATEYYSGPIQLIHTIRVLRGEALWDRCILQDLNGMAKILACEHFIAEHGLCPQAWAIQHQQAPPFGLSDEQAHSYLDSVQLNSRNHPGLSRCVIRAVTMGKRKAFHFLEKHFPHLIHFKSEDQKKNLASYALRPRCPHLLMYILENDPSIMTEQCVKGNNLLHEALHKPELIEYLKKLSNDNAL